MFLFFAQQLHWRGVPVVRVCGIFHCHKNLVHARSCCNLVDCFVYQVCFLHFQLVKPPQPIQLIWLLCWPQWDWDLCTSCFQFGQLLFSCPTTSPAWRGHPNHEDTFSSFIYELQQWFQVRGICKIKNANWEATCPRCRMVHRHRSESMPMSNLRKSCWPCANFYDVEVLQGRTCEIFLASELWVFTFRSLPGNLMSVAFRRLLHSNETLRQHVYDICAAMLTACEQL